MTEARHLRPGCRCYVRLSDGIKVRGTFLGYTLVGEINTLTFETIAGTTRLIPETHIIHIDILEGPGAGHHRAKPEDGNDYFYG